MKKTIKFCLAVLLLINSLSSIAQGSLELASSREFIASVLDAHRTYQESAFLQKKEIEKKYGTDSPKFQSILKAEAVFKSGRSNINALLYNMDNINYIDRVTAVEKIEFYIDAAKKLENTTAPSFRAMEITSDKVEINNKAISESLVLDFDGDLTRITPDNSLELQIEFSANIPAENTRNYVLYFFPRNWIYLTDRLLGADIGTGNNLAPFYTTLDRYAHKWSVGTNSRLDHIYSGKFTLVIIDKSKNFIIYFEDILIPSKGKFTYTIKN